MFYPNWQEAQANDKVGRPVDGDGDGSGHGASSLAEQFRDQEPRNGTRSSSEHNHKEDDQSDAEIRYPAHVLTMETKTLKLDATNFRLKRNFVDESDFTLKYKQIVKKLIHLIFLLYLATNTVGRGDSYRPYIYVKQRLCSSLPVRASCVSTGDPRTSG